MAAPPVASLMYQIAVLKQELEGRAASLLGISRTAFQETSVRNPRFSPPELGFYQTVTWLYAFYYEAGRISVRFLIDRLETYGLSQDGDHRGHYGDVRRLRTFLQHNLNLDSVQGIGTRRTCEEWFSKACRSVIPGSDKEWNQCLVHILRDSEAFLAAAIDCVRAIERDEASNMTIHQWSTLLLRYHPKHEFENLVSMVIHDIGQDSLDPAQLTERYYENWSRNLRFRSEGYIFEEEARRLIEQTILNEAQLPPPVSGLHIMREFGIPPGPEVGDLLRKAKALYDANPSGLDRLIARLKCQETHR